MIDNILSYFYLLLQITVVSTTAFVFVRTMFDGSCFKQIEKVHMDSHGNLSWIRVGSSFLLIATVVLMFHEYNVDKKIDGSLITALVGIVLGGKVAQKFAETTKTTSATTKTDVKKEDDI